MGSSGSESSTPDKVATAASIFTEQSNLVSKCKRFEQKYRLALEQKVHKSKYWIWFFFSLLIEFTKSMLEKIKRKNIF